MIDVPFNTLPLRRGILSLNPNYSRPVRSAGLHEVRREILQRFCAKRDKYSARFETPTMSCWEHDSDRFSHLENILIFMRAQKLAQTLTVTRTIAPLITTAVRIRIVVGAAELL